MSRAIFVVIMLRMFYMFLGIAHMRRIIGIKSSPLINLDASLMAYWMAYFYFRNKDTMRSSSNQIISRSLYLLVIARL
ncbi:hypothetical protein Gohar_007252 [Gossypium harknessii]|uniref:Uncharacterized protein n=1 Tax=Gossypium harknessii TaxID=34285 RepID=A0A7J9GGK6_9ROSI|nr:hypothetical protein [Gossypium harknessii]